MFYKDSVYDYLSQLKVYLSWISIKSEQPFFKYFNILYEFSNNFQSNSIHDSNDTIWADNNVQYYTNTGVIIPFNYVIYKQLVLNTLKIVIYRY